MNDSSCLLPEVAELDQPTLLPGALDVRPVAPLRVLHVINGEHYSGAERVEDLLAENLGPLGYDVSLVALKAGRFAAHRHFQQAPLYTLAMKSRVDLRPAWQMARLVRNERFALIHTHSPRAALVGCVASALAGVPLVHHLHSPTARESTRGWQDVLSARLERYTLSGVSALIAVSDSLAEYAVEQGIPANRVRVVANGVPTAGPLVPRETPRGTWTLGAVALFRPRKGLEVLLDALAQLRAAGHDVRLRSVGTFETPAYQQAIQAQVARLGLGEHVDWVGFTDDVPAELAKLDLFVLPSLFGEGLPMVILEAMAAGVPVVGTRVEGIPQAISDGVDGCLARPNDPADLAAAIARYLRGEVSWSAVRASAHRRQAQSFSVSSMAQGVAAIYQQVLDR